MTDTKKRKNRITIKDVARAANVSIATVSYVLNNKEGQTISEETRKKILQFANLLGYECNVMAKYLATGRTNTVTVIVKDCAPFASQYYMRLITELSRLFDKQHLDLRINDYDDGMKHGSDCDAYITVALTEREFRKFADTKYVPVIAIDSALEDFLFYRITDDYAAAADAARAEDPSRKIALLTFELPEEVTAVAEEHFDEVKTVAKLSDIAELDRSVRYVTYSSSIYDNAALNTDVILIDGSPALKAEAAVGAVVNAINREPASPKEHRIEVRRNR